MMIEVLKSKLHCVQVTEANLNYMGSITIDEDLMDAAGMLEGEQVHIVNNNNGERIETYVIKGERGSGCICLNGAAARKVQVGDIVIIMSYALMDFEEAKRWYDGYHFTGNLHIYNPKSVVDSIRRRKISNYWTSTETYESLKWYIGMNFDGLKDAIIQMIAGGRCKIHPPCLL